MPDARMYPASLTKVMTAVVVLDHADALDDVVEAPADMFPALWEQNASMAGLQPGESATVEDMLYGLMLPSGADCAIALARYVAGDVEAFVELMNRTAAALGMSGTHFTNPTGLHDADHYSTARDMTMLFAHAMRNGHLPHHRRLPVAYDVQRQPARRGFDRRQAPCSRNWARRSSPAGGSWPAKPDTRPRPACAWPPPLGSAAGPTSWSLRGRPGDHATSQADVDDARYVYGQIPGL